MPTVEERYDRAFRPLERVDRRAMTNAQINRFNRYLIDRAPLVAHTRRRVEVKMRRTLAAYLISERQRISQAMKRSGVWDDLARDAASIYLSYWTPTTTEAQVKRSIHDYIRRSPEVGRRIQRRIEQVVARDVRDAYADFPAILRVFHVLFAETAGVFMQGYVAQADTFIQAVVMAVKTISTEADILSETGGFGLLSADLEFAEFVSATDTAIIDAIRLRGNLITAVPLKEAEFSALKDIISRDLFEGIKGGKGAEGIAHDIVGFLGDKLPTKEAKQKAMLWARTEATVLQNDVLMLMGHDAGMDGKVWSSAGDDNVRPGHVSNEIDGVIHVSKTFSDGSVDAGSGSVDPFNCILPGNKVRGTFLLGTKAFYAGPAVELHTRNGNRLTLTVNHPVLTKDGFIPAGDLKQRMNVVSDGTPFIEGLEMGLPQYHEYQTPTVIEEVFRTIKERTISVWRSVHRRRALGVDFHGDGKFVDGEVEIVGADCFLRGNVNASVLTGTDNFPLVYPTPYEVPLCSNGSFDFNVETIDASTSSFPGGAALSLDKLAVSFDARPFKRFRLGHTSGRNSLLHNSFTKDTSVNIVRNTQLVQRDSGFVFLDDSLDVRDDGFTGASDGDPVGYQRTLDDALMDIKLPGELSNGRTSDIAFDEITCIRFFDYCGHVYDLQSVSGLIIAQNICISNCRCVSGPAVLPKRRARAA